jgi:uncharacterized membrane protein
MMWLFWPLAVVPLVFLWAIRDEYGFAPGGSASQDRRVDGHNVAVQIARERLARGEITVSEYDTIRRVLG